ncbi:helicase-associated domain-containing protein [Georgenia sp. 10Sc9-8]|uniref:Helicase-associated domain-containing protein n=1 Tax=Georgenia halotolerans TaxID=3028317 RepID=A0ABT5TZ43_9MICO|nr:helicase-associated domain-containing protein [Georgenia halotolerans]
MTQTWTATGEELVRALAGRPDAELVRLLGVRPDLATPAPSSMTALAARAATRPSVERALALLDRFGLTVVESLAALSATGRPTASGVAAALAVPEGAVAEVMDRLIELALLVDGAPVPAVVEAVGPHPAGLGPPLSELPRSDDAADPPPAPTTPDQLADLLRSAPPEAGRTLAELRWGPPVVTPDGDRPGASWLLEHGVLRPLSGTQLALPLEVGLAARDGRTHREVQRTPPTTELPQRPAAVVAAEGTRAAEEVVRLVATLLAVWQQEPPVALRNGGLGVRELRRAAAVLEIRQHDAATVVELMGMAGLVAPYETGEESLWAPTLGAETWADEALGVQWARLAGAWLSSARTPWLVGTRNDQGTLRAALDPSLERGWARRLRHRLLTTLAALPARSAPGAAELAEVLRWHAPRATPPQPAVAAVLAEATILGVVGAGALTDAGRALTEGEDAAAALEKDLPEPVSEILVQGDLTGVVPGRPAPELGALLGHATETESRGSALTVRFTPASVHRALDAGLSGEELLEALRRYSRTPLPQPLEYLVTDTARRHGQVRVGAATSYVRLQDPGTAGELQGHPDLAVLQLRPIAPTVLVSSARPAELLEALRAAGVAPVLEGPEGSVATVPSAVGRAGVRAPAGRGRRSAEAPVRVRRPGPEDLAELVRRMRTGEERARRSAEQHASGVLARTDPVHALAVLREATRAGAQVDLVIVGATGRAERRRVQPLSVDAGRVRMRDTDRDAEITVAVHRIQAVAPVQPA